MVGIGADAIWIAVFFSPKAFDDATVNFRIMRRFDGVCRSFLGRKLNKGISFFLEHSYVLDGAKRRKSFLYQLICDAICETSTIYGAIGRTTLVIHLLRTTICI